MYTPIFNVVYLLFVCYVYCHDDLLCWCILFYFAHLLFSVQNIHRCWTLGPSSRNVMCVCVCVSVYEFYTNSMHTAASSYTQTQSLYLHWFKYQFKNTLDWIHSWRITKFSLTIYACTSRTNGLPMESVVFKWRLDIYIYLFNVKSIKQLLPQIFCFKLLRQFSVNFNGVWRIQRNGKIHSKKMYYSLIVFTSEALFGFHNYLFEQSFCTKTLLLEEFKTNAMKAKRTAIKVTINLIYVIEWYLIFYFNKREFIVF